MIDPVTLIAGATALYNGIKQAVDAGHDIMDTADKVGSLFSRVAEITQVASAPRRKKIFQSQADFEAEAVKLYAAKAKAHQMALEVKNMFIARYGRHAWDGIQRQVIEMRKEAARRAAEELKEREEARRDVIFAVGIVGGVILLMGLIGGSALIWARFH